MEAVPGGEGISVLDTDLEVDFAPPVGYVEPERPKAPPPPTMASKLKIDLNSASPGSSRPGSSLSGGFAGTSTGQTTLSKEGDQWESFKGRGETLGGRKTKGKGISHRKVEAVPEGSKIIKTEYVVSFSRLWTCANIFYSNRKIVSNETLESGTRVPGPLNLPFGQLFFGFNIPPYQPPNAPASPGSPGAPSVRTSSFFSPRMTSARRPITLPMHLS